MNVGSGVVCLGHFISKYPLFKNR